MVKIYAVVAAAGKSTRMGGIDKQMFCLKDVPVLIHSLNLFENIDSLKGIVLVAPPDAVSQYREEVKKWNLKKVINIVPGGENRQQSVYFGLLAIPSDCEIILVHDGARPLVTLEEINILIEAVSAHGAATLAVPVKDTVKDVDSEEFVTCTPDRERFWLAQTPQGFCYNILWSAHRSAREKQLAFTDDASMVEAQGYRVKIVRGSYSNIKITTREDLLVAAALLSRKE